MMRAISYKSAVWVFFAALLIAWSIPPVGFFIYDPLQLFHKAWGRPSTFLANMRQQAAGVINNFEFDGIILGTSMLENSSADEASALLGGRFVNISMGASDHFERSLILQYALTRKKLASVIYSMDLSYVSLEKGNRNYPVTSYDYLYDDNRLNDFKAYFNDHFLGCLALWSLKPACVGASASLDRPNAWFELPVHASRFGGIDNWFSARNTPQVKRALRAISKAAGQVGKSKAVDQEVLEGKRREMLHYLDTYVLAHPRKHPGTRFHYVFPPYSRIRFSMLHQTMPMDAALHEEGVRYMVRAASRLRNVFVYGYEDQDFPDDLANYKDPGHYKVEFNSMMLRDAAQGTHRLDARGLDTYLASAREKALAFDLAGLGSRIDAYLQVAAKNGRH